MKEQIPQQDPRLMIVMTAHLSSVGEHGYDDQYHEVSLIQSTSHNSLLPFSLAQLKWFYSYCISSFQGIQIDSTSVVILSLSLLASLKLASAQLVICNWLWRVQTGRH